MSIIYILIPVAIVFTALGVYLFFWAVKTEQFDDLEKQGMSILFDEKDKNDELVMSSNEKHNKLEIESSKGNKEINKKSSGKE